MLLQEKLPAKYIDNHIYDTDRIIGRLHILIDGSLYQHNNIVYSPQV